MVADGRERIGAIKIGNVATCINKICKRIKLISLHALVDQIVQTLPNGPAYPWRIGAKED